MALAPQGLTLLLQLLIVGTLFYAGGAQELPATVAADALLLSTQQQPALTSTYAPLHHGIKGAPLYTLPTDTTNPSATAAAVIPMAIVAPPALYKPNLDQHNAYRARHINTPPLGWDDAWASSALTYASKCIWGHDPTNNGQWGENIYAYSAYTNNTQHQLDGLAAWYNEIQYYDWNNPGFSGTTGHFTQIVWNDTTALGCAAINCPNGLTNPSGGTLGYLFYMVCRYYPPGNYIGADNFRAHVNPLITSSSPSPSSPSPPPSPRPPPSPSPPPSTVATIMNQGYVLRSSSSPNYVSSPNGRYLLYMGTNGIAQLVKDGTTTLWYAPTSTSTASPFRFTVETTGRLTVKTSGGSVRWYSNTANPTGFVGPYKLRLQDDGNMRLLDSANRQVWQSNTVQP